jgi:hypothetical protein
MGKIGIVGNWFEAGFDHPCSRDHCGGIKPGATIRADANGSFECKSCVNQDETKPKTLITNKGA